MGMGGGGGSTVITAHKHTNGAGQGGPLDANVTLIDTQTIDAFVIPKYGPVAQTGFVTSDTSFTSSNGKVYIGIANESVGDAGKYYVITSCSIWGDQADADGTIGYIVVRGGIGDPPTATTMDVLGTGSTVVSAQSGEVTIRAQKKVIFEGGGTVSVLLQPITTITADILTVSSQSVRFVLALTKPTSLNQITGASWEANTRVFKIACNFREVLAPAS